MELNEYTKNYWDFEIWGTMCRGGAKGGFFFLAASFNFNTFGAAYLAIERKNT